MKYLILLLLLFVNIYSNDNNAFRIGLPVTIDNDNSSDIFTNSEDHNNNSLKYDFTRTQLCPNDGNLDVNGKSENTNGIRYYDHNLQNSFTYNGTTYIFVEYRGQICAVEAGLTRSQPIRLTDFVQVEALDYSAFDKSTGILYVQTVECYSNGTLLPDDRLKNAAGNYKYNTIFAVDVYNLLDDVANISISPNRDDYFTQLAQLPTLSRVYGTGCGFVIDKKRNRLLVAATNANARTNYHIADPTPDIATFDFTSIIYSIDISEKPNFSIRKQDRIPTNLLEIGFGKLSIGHMFINPWNEDIVGIDNYAGFPYDRGSGTQDERNETALCEKYNQLAKSFDNSAPSCFTYLDFSKDSEHPRVFHLTDPSFTGNNDIEHDRRFCHFSFISKDAIIGCEDYYTGLHQFRQYIFLMGYPYGKKLCDMYSDDATINNITLVDAITYYNVSKDFGIEGKSPSHVSMSPDRKFIVYDFGFESNPSSDLDSLALLFKTADGNKHVFTITKNLQNSGTGKPVHPHAGFLGDNKTIIFNAKMMGLANTGKDDSFGEGEYVVIPNALLNLPIVPFASSFEEVKIKPNKAAGSPFRLLVSKTEITQEEYYRCMLKNPSTRKNASISLPVENVTWYDAVLFCNAKSKECRLDTVYSYTGLPVYDLLNCTNLSGISINYNKNGYRLPTKDEWIYAYRAGTTTDDAIPSGSNISDYAWYYGNAGLYEETQSVATKLPNLWGLNDMAGNVQEWTTTNSQEALLFEGSIVHVLGYLNKNWTKNYFVDKDVKNYYTGFRTVRKKADITPVLNLLLN